MCVWNTTSSVARLGQEYLQMACQGHKIFHVSVCVSNMTIVHRYDDTDHHIFKTLETQHKGDFYNASASLEVPECGPRQPWHDIHRYPLNIFPLFQVCAENKNNDLSLLKQVACNCSCYRVSFYSRTFHTVRSRAVRLGT